MQLEFIALRHQLAVYKQSGSRPTLRPSDRLFWVWLSRLWSGWQQVLTFVQPRTVIAWQKKRFRDHWRRLSQRGTPGRPAIAKEVRELIQDMVAIESDLGLASHCRGTAEAWHRCRQIDGGEVSAKGPQAVLANLEGVPEQPCPALGCL